MKQLELLAPAKNYEYGREAISHGADAVYIGPEKFGARAAAGNCIDDIEKLAGFAHRFNSKVYIAFNTILFDHELQEAEKEIHRLWNAGADALIIQDMGILQMDLPPIPLFASTQTDNRDPKRIKFLEHAGFERIILARELSLKQIKLISKNTNADLEAFVHGALCVSYSGRCYLSHALGKRSANRGECGQPCRLPWRLESSEGKIISENKHLLSLRDMNRSLYLKELIDAGITSFKIEGRLKDISYLKNITALYRQRLDSLMDKKPDLIPSSSGKTEFFFMPSPEKTFNRGETDYFLNGKRGVVNSFDTPKSIGEKIGKVRKIYTDSFVVETEKEIRNGDGLCFFNKKGKLHGLKVNRAENKRIYPSTKTGLKNASLSPGSMIFRNYNHGFIKALSGKTSSRKIGLELLFVETEKGFILRGIDEDSNQAEVFLETEKIIAENREKALSTLKKQLSKLGDSIFYLKNLEIESDLFFLRASEINSLRRNLISKTDSLRSSSYLRKIRSKALKPLPYPHKEIGFDHNVSNRLAKAFYENHGVKKADKAFEIQKKNKESIVMTTKHCIRYSLGLCLRNKNADNSGSLYLCGKEKRLRLDFNCKECEMSVVSEEIF